MQKRIKILSKRHFQNNFVLYFLLFSMFIIGIIIGAILINRLKREQNHNIIGYFSWILDYIKNGEELSVNILRSSLLSNIRFTIIIWLSGFIFLGIIVIPLIIGLKGFSIGFIVGFIVKEFGIKGFIFAILGLLPYYLIILPGILAIGSLGLSSSIASSRRGKTLYKGNQNDIIDYSMLILLFFMIISLGSFVESFVTPYFLKITKFNL